MVCENTFRMVLDATGDDDEETTFSEKQIFAMSLIVSELKIALDE